MTPLKEGPRTAEITRSQDYRAATRKTLRFAVRTSAFALACFLAGYASVIDEIWPLLIAVVLLTSSVYWRLWEKESKYGHEIQEPKA